MLCIGIFGECDMLWNVHWIRFDHNHSDSLYIGCFVVKDPSIGTEGEFCVCYQPPESEVVSAGQWYAISLSIPMCHIPMSFQCRCTCTVPICVLLHSQCQAAMHWSNKWFSVNLSNIKYWNIESSRNFRRDPENIVLWKCNVSRSELVDQNLSCPVQTLQRILLDSTMISNCPTKISASWKPCDGNALGTMYERIYVMNSPLNKLYQSACNDSKHR